MTLPRVRALYEAFKQQPPTHWLAAAYMGYKPPREKRALTGADLFELTGGQPVTLDMLAMFG